jgi:hypothetical protein
VANCQQNVSTPASCIVAVRIAGDRMLDRLGTAAVVMILVESRVVFFLATATGLRTCIQTTDLTFAANAEIDCPTPRWNELRRNGEQNEDQFGHDVTNRSKDDIQDYRLMADGSMSVVGRNSALSRL